MGDMFKAVYDTDNDGVVDDSEALQGHPASDFETPTGAQGKVDTHSGASSGIHGVGASTVESVVGSAAKVSTHDGLASPHASATSLEKTANKGVANGYASLDADGDVPDAQIPDGVARDTEVAAYFNTSTGHDHDNTDSKQVDHANLLNKGTNLHSVIDTHLAASAPHSGHEQTANKGAASGYAPLDAASKVPTVNLGGAGASSLNYLRGDQTWVTPAGGAEVEQIVRTTGDITNSTTTFADVTGLTFAVAANTDYIFEAWLIFRSDTQTTGIKFAVNGPASPTAVVIQTHIPITLVSVTQGAAVAYDSGTASASVAVINTSYLGHVTGIIRNGANSGTLAIRFAAETTGIVKIMTGSVLRYRQTL